MARAGYQEKCYCFQREEQANLRGILKALVLPKEASRKGEGSDEGRNQKKSLDREFPHGPTAHIRSTRRTMNPILTNTLLNSVDDVDG
jgi:hypothetical protein